MNKKEKEQKEFINNLKKEVDKLENEVTNIKKANVKRAVIKNVRIFGKKVRKYAPIMAAGVLVSTLFVNNIGVPFFQTPVKASAYIKTEEDSLGNIDVLKQYDAFKDTTSYVEVYSPWEKDGEDYVRSIKGYIMDNENFEKCMAIVKGDAIPVFSDIFEAPSTVLEQRSNHIDESELKIIKELKKHY